MLEPVHVAGVTIKHGDPAQRGGPGPQGHPGGRGGDRAAGRRRDPAGALAGARTSPSDTDRPPPPRPPQRCPVCDTPTVKPEGSVFTRCPNRDCPGRRWQLLTHYVAAMDIDGLGEKQVSLFMELGWVRTAADFYRPRRRADRRAQRLRRGLGREAGQRDRGIQAAAVRPGAVRARASRRWAASPAATSPSSSAPSTRCSPPIPRRSSRPRASGPRWRTTIHEQLARRDHAGADRRPARAGAAVRGGGPARRARARWPARRSSSPARCPS